MGCRQFLSPRPRVLEGVSPAPLCHALPATAECIQEGGLLGSCFGRRVKDMNIKDKIKVLDEIVSDSDHREFVSAGVSAGISAGGRLLPAARAVLLCPLLRFVSYLTSRVAPTGVVLVDCFDLFPRRSVSSKSLLGVH